VQGRACAGHLATQVLETLAKTGQPTRAEITDAAAGQRAECVMLKGPHITDAIRALDDILARMDAVQTKSCTLMRPSTPGTPIHAGSVSNYPFDGAA
jgi:pyruvate kinase